MQVTYFWLMLSCLICGTAVLCEQMCPNQGSDSLDIKCAHNGNCGKVHTNKEEMSLYGNKKHIEAPWHAVIYRYRFNKKMSNHYSLCLGSIIAPKLVISVAHCFWQRDLPSKKISVNDGQYKVAVGKYARNFTIVDNKFTKIMNVEFVYLSDGYTGYTGFHASNIAIIVLRDKISFSEVVAPVCIDWNGKYKEVNGDQGKVVSWGDAERGTHLLELSIPYIERNTCRNIYTDEFQTFVTVDKFCAGSKTVSGQGVVMGDSGSGLCFLHSNSYFLTGLVSSKNPEANDSIAAFTEVKYHIQWIRELYDQHYSTQ